MSINICQVFSWLLLGLSMSTVMGTAGIAYPIIVFLAITTYWAASVILNRKCNVRMRPIILSYCFLLGFFFLVYAILFISQRLLLLHFFQILF